MEIPDGYVLVPRELYELVVENLRTWDKHTEQQTEWEVRLTSVGEKFIGTIKEVRHIGGYGLKEAKELVDAVRDGDPQVVISCTNYAAAIKYVERLESSGGTACVA